MSWILSEDAELDALEIWTYVRDQSGSTRADSVLRDLRRAFDLVAAAPGAGHDLPALADDRYRFYTVHSWLIAYLWRTRPVEIVRIVHGARDLPAVLGLDPDRP